MGFLRRFLDKQEKLFEKGGKFEKLYPLFEAGDAFLFTTGKTATKPSFVRDGADLKRVMMTVVVALVPAILMAMYNTGLQANLALADGAAPIEGWRTSLIEWLGVGLDPESAAACFLHGAVWFIPVLFVTFLVGGLWEVLFAVVRKHEVNEGFLVTGMLFPLILPPAIPLWQVALGITFGVVIGKEVFGGTGYNVLNPALTARAFLFFGYPAAISGDQVWIAVDGYTSATPLAVAFGQGLESFTSEAWWDAFYGFIPGSMGETSTLAVLIGAVILLISQVSSWRIVASILVGTFAMTALLNAVGSDTNPMFALPFHWHLVIGGFAFGTVFMATDPVSAAYSNTGKLIYGFLIGVLIVMVRVLNPAYPEGVMVSILLMNVFAPLIDFYVVRGHIKKRKARYV